MAEFPQAPAATSVLVVEDEALLLVTIADDLRAAGFLTLEAGSASRAMALLEARDGVDVLFTDVHMVGARDGLDLARTVRTRWPRTHLIVTSGHVRPAADEMPSGAVFLAKPYEASAVVSAVHRLLSAT